LKPQQVGQTRRATSSPSASETSSSQAAAAPSPPRKKRPRVATKAVSRSKGAGKRSNAGELWAQAGMLQLQFTRLC
jgi:hypothetical protein